MQTAHNTAGTHSGPTMSTILTMSAAAIFDTLEWVPAWTAAARWSLSGRNDAAETAAALLAFEYLELDARFLIERTVRACAQNDWTTITIGDGCIIISSFYYKDQGQKDASHAHVYMFPHHDSIEVSIDRERQGIDVTGAVRRIAEWAKNRPQL